MKPIRESAELDWEGEHMQPNTLRDRPLSTRTKAPNFEKLWRETQEQFNKMEARAIRLEAHAQRLADACAAYVRARNDGGISMADLSTIADRAIREALAQYNESPADSDALEALDQLEQLEEGE